MSGIDKAIPQGADGNLDKAQIDWLRLMPDGWNGGQMSELKPCPFCGGEASKRLFYKGKYRVHCNVCDAHSGDVCDTEAKAIAAWNTRVDYHGYEQAAIEAWESIKAWNSRAERTCEFAPDGMMDERLWFACSNCGGYITTDYGMPSYCPHCGAKVVVE